MTDMFDELKKKQDEIRKKQIELLAEVFTQSITIKRKYVYCPMCLTKMDIRVPEEFYRCCNCGAMFDIYDYGKEYEVNLKREVEKGLSPEELKILKDALKRHEEALKLLAE